jgi:hypothetical protein
MAQIRVQSSSKYYHLLFYLTVTILFGICIPFDKWGSESILANVPDARKRIYGGRWKYLTFINLVIKDTISFFTFNFIFLIFF